MNSRLPISDETKMKISKALTGRKRGYFRPTSEGTKQKLRRVALGKPLSEEHKARISAGLIGHKGIRGIVWSKETIMKRSKALTGKPRKFRSEEIKKKMSMLGRQLGKSCLGKTKKFKNEESKMKMVMIGRKLGKSCLGKTKKFRTEESRKKMIAHGKRLSQRENFKMPFRFTLPEKQMQKILSNLAIPFIPQYHVSDIKHDYLADFFLPKDNAIIEVDGKYWHNFPDGKEIDGVRNKEMADKGYTVFRFWEGGFSEQDVLKKLDRYVLEVDVQYA